MNLDISTTGGECPLCGDAVTKFHRVKTTQLSNMTFRDDAGRCEFMNRGTGITYVYVHVPERRESVEQ